MPIYSKDGGSASVKPPSTVAKVPVVAPKPPAQKPVDAPKPPQVFWFQGRAYTSVAAYSAAVAAAKQAAAIAAQARQRIDASAKQAALLAAQKAATQRQLTAYREQAALEARRRSEELRRQALARAQARARANFERIAAARRSAESRRLLTAQGGTLQRENAALAQRVAAHDQRLVEQRIADARTQAYNNLARRASGALRVTPRGVANIDTPAVRNSVTPKQHQRRQLLTAAETTGDWSPVIEQLSRESTQSNGRVVDPRLLAEVMDKYVAPMSELRDEFSELVAALNEAERKDDDEALLALVEDPENIALYEQFIAMFGDGTKPGAFTAHQQALADISAARERAWVAGMAAGTQATDREVTALQGKISRESQVRSRQLPGRGPQMIDERYEDLRYTEQVLDPETGRMRDIERVGSDAWLAREQVREGARVAANHRQTAIQNQALSRLMDAEDSTFLGHDGEGRRVVQSNDVARQAAFITEHMPRWRLDRNGVPNRISAAGSNRGLQEQLIREFMQDASDTYDREHADDLASLRRGMLDRSNVIGSGQQARTRYEKTKRAWLDAMARRLGRPGWSLLDQASTTGAGGVLQGVLTGMSVIPAIVRRRLQEDFGNWQPHVDIGLWGDNFGARAGVSADPNAESFRQEMDASFSTGDFWQDLGAWGSTIRDGAMWGSGNLGGLLTQAVDPFMLSGPGRFGQAGALAMARAGGVRSFLGEVGRGGVSSLARDFARYAGPNLKIGGRQVLAGAGRDVVRVEMAKLRLAQKLGMPGGEALRLSDDQFKELASRLAADTSEEMLKSDLIRSLTEATGIEKTQLLNMVQQELPAILREFRIFAESPFEAAKRMRAIRTSAIRARSQAESAAQLAKMEADRAADMAELAAFTGRPLQAPKLDATGMATHSALVAAYSKSAQEYLAVAERGLKAAMAIEAGDAATDPRRLRGLQAQLNQAVKDIAKYEDRWIINLRGRKMPAQRGIVSRRFEQLRRFRGQGDPTAPSFIDSSMAQILYDERRVRTQMTRVKAQMTSRSQLGQPLTALKVEMKRLEAARRGLLYERATIDNGRSMMNKYANKQWARVEHSITPQRIAPVVANDEQLGLEIGRDFMRALHDVQVRDVIRLTPEQDAAWQQMRVTLSAPAPRNLVGLLPVDDARNAVAALRDAPTRLELWTALRMAAVDPLLSREMRLALRQLDDEMISLARRSGFRFGKNVKRRQAADRLWDLMNEDHVRLDAPAVGLTEFSALDAKVQGALQEWRDHIAEGQVRQHERSFKKPVGPRRAVNHDIDPFENLVKMRVLKAEGVSIYAYDEMRGVLQRPMLRRNAAIGILHRAVKRARRTGESLDEAVKAERAATQRIEVIRNVEEFSTRPGMEGLPPEARLRAYEEKIMADDLPEALGTEVSRYQESILRRAFGEETGFSFDDKHLVAKFYRGELHEIPAGARLPRDGEFMYFAEADGIHMWVVPKGHPKLDDAIPFAGRPRSLDDELAENWAYTQQLLRDTDLSLDDAPLTAEISKESREIMRGWEDRLSRGDETRADDIPLPIQRESKKAWDMVEDNELPEDMAARRGATAGRRQNAAAEARRSSRRNFEQKPGGASGQVNQRYTRTYGWHEKAAPAGWETNPQWAEFPVEAIGPEFGMDLDAYHRWLWDEMRRSSEFRNLLGRLRGRQIVHSDGAKAQILANAVEFMKTSKAREMFSPNAHVASLAYKGGAGTVAQLAQKKAQYEQARTVARQNAGQQWQATAGEWELAKIGDLAVDEDGTIVQLTYSAGLKGQITTNRWLPIKNRDKRFQIEDQAGVPKIERGDLPRLVDLRGQPHRTNDVRKVVPVEGGGRKLMPMGEISGTHVFRPTKGRWVKNPEFGDDPTGRWAEKVRAFDKAIQELDVLLADAKAGKMPRPRANVGMSIHGEGVFIAEGTSNVTVAHEIFHQFWDDDFNAVWRTDIEDALVLMGPGFRSQLWSSVRIGTQAYDEAEMAAELFALWRVGDAAGSDVLYSWSDIRALITDASDKAAFDRLGQIFGEHAPRVVETVMGKLNVPPLGHRGRLFAWFEEKGYWSRRTGEAIRAGEQVWSVEQERSFLRGFMEYEAPWLDEDSLRVVLNDPRLHNAFLRSHGFFDDDYETLAGSAGDLTGSQMTDSVVWGKGDFKRQRTVAEMREWSIQRYGELVSDDGTRLVRMPWLMSADQEYVDWTKGFFDDTFAGAQRPSLDAARDKLPQVIRDHLWDGDNLKSVGMQIDPRLVKAKEVEKLRAAIINATRRRLRRMHKVGDVEPGDWLAQETLRFAYDVTDQLLVDPVWRGFLRGKPVVGSILHAWGQFWRMLVSWQPAFPIMNLLESYGFKRLYLAVYQGGFRPLSRDADGLRLLPGDTSQVLRAIGAESDSLFGLSGGSAWARVGDGYLNINERGGALIRGVSELPIKISQFGEDHLRMDFARRVAGDTFRSARRTGMSVENAEWLAKIEAGRLVHSFFAVAKGAGWQSALNELVPFFSYNWKNKTLAVRMLWNHPSAWVWGERLRREIEQANREQWEKDHPGVEFPEGPSASWLWWKVGDDYYKIDLSAFSDWTRAIGSVTEEHTPLAWLTEFIRVPHPSQLGALAMFTGGETPWGTPGSIRELTMWADLFYWSRGIDYSDPRRRRDGIQIASQLLFFKAFGHTGAMDIKQATFFSLRQQDPKLAREYLEANPDLQLYWDSLGPRNRVQGFDPITATHFRQLMSEEENREYDAALAALDRLNARLDTEIAEHAAEPWSDEYKAAKRNAFLLRKAFFADNPLLTRAWGTFMTPREFAELNEDFRLDQLADAWFNWKRPQSDDFETELAYQQAVVAFNERRAAFLDANPALARRLEEGRTAVETAWRGQELHWTEVLDFQARLKIRIIEAEAAGDDADRDLIDLLYRAKDFAGADLDADRYGVFGGPVSGKSRFFASLPGFADYRYNRASPEGQRQMKADESYFDTLRGIGRQLKAEGLSGKAAGKRWYEIAESIPGFLDDYFTRNPDKKAAHEANGEYVRWMGAWVAKLEVRNFDAAQAVWDSMPAWVKERYFVAHPDSGMRDGMGAGGTAVEYNGQWFKSPESRDRYIAFIENGGSNGTWSEGFAEPTTFRSPEARQRYLDGQAYYSSMGRWVKMLQAKDYVAADRYFRALPDWMKEKYYAKHPDQRARNDFDLAALRAGAEYFLAVGDDKLKILANNPALRQWLAENGGEEGAMRGLINAMYRAIPSTEPWLKRTFRERFPEIFSQEAAGERRIASVAAELAEHPEMLPFFEKALLLQSRLFMDQLKRMKTPPKQWTLERKQRLVKRGKRRAARLNSHWSLHRDLRRGR